MLARGLAEFAASLKPDAIPPEVIERATACILDCLGAALAGSSTALAQGLLQMIEQEGGHQEATLIGRGGRATMRQTVLYNGAIAHALDYDDVSWSMNGHPSVTLVPPVLAIGERFGRAGREL
ncbi:MAG: MmgE/PrpD family protein, partial [Deltaproteobacteria bacterium]|nr:MmgE/PrpD family protein [Deltaproteobacteria bacterium]